ncbi:hypothetical protein M8J75_007657 [Diaphorina citri]|nr:hypothetical protein M8J75_007657 [Diaphorina citri]
MTLSGPSKGNEIEMIGEGRGALYRLYSRSDLGLSDDLSGRHFWVLGLYWLHQPLALTNNKTILYKYIGIISCSTLASAFIAIGIWQLQYSCV